MTARITPLPRHVAIIMDGNGRWAERHGLPRLAGHDAGLKRVRPVVGHLAEYNIPYVTLYSFSTENWNRPREEVSGLFRLLEENMDRQTDELHRQGARVRHLGRLSELPQSLQVAINKAVELTKNNTHMTLSFAFNYGGRTEIVDAVRRLIAANVPPEKIDEALFNEYLYTTGIPDVDLVIRTGGELRVSNFLLWQAAYSEYYFTRVLWPEFGKRELDRALLSYSQRQRRFGGL